MMCVGKLVCRLSLVLICLSLSTLDNRPAVSQSKQDVLNIQKVIRLQIEAMRRDDWDEAFEYASRDIQRSFVNPKIFRKMVLAKYRIVYQPRLSSFKKIKLVNGVLAQGVYMIDDRGKSAMVVYFMRQDENRNWRINGVQLFPEKKLAI
tara:strand:- start:3940 stop:4386 length:447 start_codon:yes stop_codon:yes gene_type:complete